MQGKSNDYSAGIKRLPEEKLREYIEKPEDFQDEAILAAIWELEGRRGLLKDEQELEKVINTRTSLTYKETILNPPVENIPEEIHIPSLYSMRSIQLFSVLFSVLAGGILMAINFNRTNQKTAAYKVVGFSLFYTVLSIYLFSLLGSQSPIISIVLNLAGALLIDELFWKKVLGREFKFQKQQIWTALAVALLIISPLVWYMVKSGIGVPA